MTAQPLSRSYEVFHRYHASNRLGSFVYFKGVVRSNNLLRTYFFEMAEAIRLDLQERGSSWLLTYLMEIAGTGRTHINIDWYVVKYLYLLSRGYAPVSVQNPLIPYSSQYFDHIQTTNLLTVTSFCKEICASLMQTPPANAHTEEELALLEEQLAQKEKELANCRQQLDDYRRQLEKYHHATEAEARQRVADECQRLISEANTCRNRAEADMLNAEAEASERIEAAEQKARRIIDEAHQEAEAHLAAAQEEADDIRIAADHAAKEMAHQAREEVLREAQLLHQSCDPSVSYDSIRQDMTSESSDLQRFLMEELGNLQQQLHSALDSFGSVLVDTRSSISTNLNRWRSELYAGEHKAAAMFYVNLYRFVNQALDQRIADAAEESVQEALKNVQQILLGHLSRCEGMMLKLGLTVIRPEKGDLSDDVYHTSPVGSIAPGERIEACLCPGVAMSGEYAPVLIPAQVILAESGQEEEEIE